ncbi:MAG: T9SS type A sorting domain-containing protein [Bacteroidetes bacterium]|nr:T9SS type A sorting domain-containing protein [Bacteroidota bacterium]
MTGNAGGGVNNDDVDDGSTILTSPVFDLTSYTNPYLNYERWFYEQFSSNPAANDTMFISIYNGNSTEVVEMVTGPSATNSSWVSVSKRILDFLSLSSSMQVSIAIEDKFGSANPLEGAFDHFSISEGPLSVSEVNSGSNFVIAPNPVTDKFEIYFNSGNGFEYQNIVISDVTGREIFKAVVNGTEQIVISTAEWNKGVYFVSMLTKTGAVSTSKLVKY